MEITAAKLQLAELQQRLVCIADERLAIQMSVEECGVERVDWDQDLLQQQQALQDQIAALSAFIDSEEDHQLAATYHCVEDAAHTADGVLAAALKAQDEWNAQLSAYDAAYALALSSCEEGEEADCLLSFPLDLNQRPETPGEATLHFYYYIHDMP